MRPAVSDGIVALAGIIGTVCDDARDLLVGRDLVEQDRRVADVAASGDLDSPNLQRFLVNPKVDLAPNTPFGTTMLACVPLALIFVLHDGMGLVAKRLEHVPNSRPPKICILSDNPLYSPYKRSIDEIRIIGRIRWFAREL